jgi:hypothetical protein
MVLGFEVQHLVIFAKKITKRMPTADIGFFHGKTAKKDKMEGLKHQIILATQKMASESLDLKTLSILFYIIPSCDVSQSSQRIIRGNLSHSDPLIIDCYDDWSIFQNYIYPRLSYYKKQGWSIESDNQEKLDHLLSRKLTRTKSNVSKKRKRESDDYCPF